jgi:hypothetical protein
MEPEGDGGAAAFPRMQERRGSRTRAGGRGSGLTLERLPSGAVRVAPRGELDLERERARPTATRG